MTPNRSNHRRRRREKLTADAALAAIPQELRAHLAPLAGASSNAVELVIGLLPYGHRALLEAYGVTKTTTPTAEGAEAVAQLDEARQRVRVTPLGRSVIESCAQLESREIPDAEELDRRAAAVRMRLRSSSGARSDQQVVEQPEQPVLIGTFSTLSLPG